MPDVDALVTGGKATPAPPLGPALAPLGVNVGQVIALINEKTKAFAGMEVPIKIHVDEKKNITVSMGTPPVSSMLKKELKKDKLATVNEDKSRNMAGNVSLQSIIKIAESKDSMAGLLKSRVTQVLGTCVSCGVTVDGRSPKDVIADIKNGTITI
ncbi:MAG: 50S ribosomal protein L11 [Candidatus Aenigmarchaeota archaeon]|nr:50S ribosomal protein L11 [Candidatus Aenigmarchaeota archaeon]